MERIYDRLADKNALIYYDPLFIDFIEMHMSDLRRQSVDAGQTIDVSAVQQTRANRNFNLLCNIAGIPFHLHWITMRINQMMSASEFAPNKTILYMVDTAYLASLVLKFKEAQNIV